MPPGQGLGKQSFSLTIQVGPSDANRHEVEHQRAVAALSRDDERLSFGLLEQGDEAASGHR